MWSYVIKNKRYTTYINYMMSLKMMPVYFDQTCLHLTFSLYLSSELYSRNYEKLQNIVIYAC